MQWCFIMYFHMRTTGPCWILHKAIPVFQQPNNCRPSAGGHTVYPVFFFFFFFFFHPFSWSCSQQKLVFFKSFQEQHIQFIRVTTLAFQHSTGIPQPLSPLFALAAMLAVFFSLWPPWLFPLSPVARPPLTVPPPGSAGRPAPWAHLRDLWIRSGPWAAASAHTLTLP